MPKISKIRVVNYHYDNGTGLIPDQLWLLDNNDSLTPVNTTLTMDNMGGKTTLLQAFLQPILPRESIAGRKIEEYFTNPTDHAYILLEWKLDNSDMYLMTGIAIAASTAVDADNVKTGRVKYYTFMSKYKDYNGKENIIKLPLSWKNEKGYFVAASYDYVRDLAKTSGALVRYSSDDGIKWRAVLAEHGISKEEFKEIAEINSKEDGISKYFDTLKANTSGKVIDELFLPCIQRKFMRSIDTTKDVSLETALIAYVRDHIKHDKVIRERDVLSGFADKMTIAYELTEKLWNTNGELVKCVAQVYSFGDALAAKKKSNEDRMVALLRTEEDINQRLHCISHEKASAEYYTAQAAYQEKSDNVSRAEKASETEKSRKEAAHRNVELLNGASLSMEIQSEESRIAAVKKAIDDKNNNTEDNRHLANLKYSTKHAVEEELKKIDPETRELSAEKEALAEEIKGLDAEMSRLDKEKSRVEKAMNKTEGAKENQVEYTDRLADALGIQATRGLLGGYPENELLAWKDKKTGEKDATQKKADAVEEEIEGLSERNDELPQKIADAKNNMDDLCRARDKYAEQIAKYKESEREVLAVCDRHSISRDKKFTDVPVVYLDGQIAELEAKISVDKQELETVDAAMASVDSGTLHIRKELLDFLNVSGINYISMEKYLLSQKKAGNLSEERINSLLEKYPYAAFAVKVDKPSYQILLEEAKNRDWLPDVLPVLTDEDIESMLSDETETSVHLLAVYAADYFANPDSFKKTLGEKKDSIHERMETRKARLSNLCDDRAAVVKFLSDYNETWLEGVESAKEKTEEKITSAEQEKSRLDNEIKEVRKKLKECNDLKNKLIASIKKLENDLSGFADLTASIEKEAALNEQLENFRNELNDSEIQYQQFVVVRAEKEADKTEKENRWNGLIAVRTRLEHILTIVEDAATADLLEGTWETLYAKYNEILSSKDKDIKDLKSQLDEYISRKTNLEAKLMKLSCAPEDYKDIVYTQELLDQAEEDEKAASDAYDKAQKNVATENLALGRAESDLEKAKSALETYGGEALPAEQVGSDFDRRIKDAKAQLGKVRTDMDDLRAVIDACKQTVSRVEDFIKEYPVRPESQEHVSLEEDHKEQMDRLVQEVKKLSAEVNNKEADVNNTLLSVRQDYGAEDNLIRERVDEMIRMLLNRELVGDRYFTLWKNMDSTISLARKRISQISSELSRHDESKENLIKQCVLQGQYLYDDMKKIAESSKVNINGTRRPMIILDMPKTVDKAIATAAITADLDKEIKALSDKMREDPDNETMIRKEAGRIVGNSNLLRKFVGGDIGIKAYKIDIISGRGEYRTWEDMNKNSGSQKNIVYYTVVFALMAYSRATSSCDYGDKVGSTIFLDNPFGSMTSGHAVKPLVEIAKLYNIQLICLSAIKIVDIVKEFDIVYELKVLNVGSGSYKIMTHDENKLIAHGYYSAEQTKLQI